MITGIDGFADNTLAVFNRWGNEVYSASGYKNNWDGKSKTGQELPDATYFIIFKTGDGSVEIKKSIELRRQAK